MAGVALHPPSLEYLLHGNGVGFLGGFGGCFPGGPPPHCSSDSASALLAYSGQATGGPLKSPPQGRRCCARRCPLIARQHVPTPVRYHAFIAQHVSMMVLSILVYQRVSTTITCIILPFLTSTGEIIGKLPSPQNLSLIVWLFPSGFL